MEGAMSKGLTEEQKAYAREIFRELVSSRKYGNQTELAEKLGLDQTGISRAKNHGTTSIEILLAAAQMAGRSPAEIERRTGVKLTVVVEQTVELDNAVYANLATALEARPNIAQDVRDYVLSIRNYGGDQPVETWLKVIDRAQDAHELNERDLGYQPAFPKVRPPTVMTDDDFDGPRLPPKIPKRR